MELRHLRYFVGVGEEQHFGRAAERLHVAQPALSRQIQDLERELGFRLLDRLPRGVRLNAAGNSFLADARRILQDVTAARLRAEQIALGKTGTLRVGIATALSWHGLVLDTFRRFRSEQPDAQIELHHSISTHQIEAILSGRLDVGLVTGLMTLSKDVARRQFAQDRMVLAVPKGHPITKRKRVQLRDLRNMQFVGFPRWANPVFYDQLMRECSRGGLTAPRVVQEAPDRDTLLGLVQCRIGLCWVGDSVRWHCPRGVVLLPVFDMNLILPFDLVWKKDNTSPLVQRFVAQVASA